MKCIILERIKIFKERSSFKLVLFCFKIIFGFFVTASFFTLLSNFPGIYRWTTKWANNPLLPLPQTCQVEEISSDDLSILVTNDQKVKRYRVIINFDEKISGRKKALVHDPKGNYLILQAKDYKFPTKKSYPYKFIQPKDKTVSFNLIAEEEEVMTGILDYQDCPVNVDLIGE